MAQGDDHLGDGIWVHINRLNRHERTQRLRRLNNQPPLEFDRRWATLIATLDLLHQPPPLHSGEGLSVTVHFLPTLPLSDVVEQRGNRNKPSRKTGQPTHQFDESRIQLAVSIEPER